MAETQRAPSAYANQILAHLSDYNIVARQLIRIEFAVKQVLYNPNEPIRYAYFPEAGMISVVSTMEDGRSIEVGTIGNEGMAGAGLLSGANSGPYNHYAQIAGHGYRIDADVLRDEASQNNKIREVILRYQSLFLVQSMQCTACNGLHSVTQRCCRWLLLSHDRVHTDTVALTHEFLALMLGVRRASVTEVLKPLQERGWVRLTRGEIAIVDRQSLESASCECYRVIKEHLKLLFE